MKVVIQCAGRKNPSAGTFRTAGGKPVIFVAHPELAPPDARTSTRGRMMFLTTGGAGARASWNTTGRLRQPARLASRCNSMNPTRTAVWLIGSASIPCSSCRRGGESIPATFLTPAYDITFSQVPKPERWKRRLKDDVYDDSCLMPNDGRPWVFLGGREYQPLLCRRQQI